ncbi:MAG: hypothetical protein Q8L37_05965 [Candidatus Gottesmanbacteria bacterium]|nr:hypothetical protein [Candidatus Gottesmanbacteria bacterium]
MTLGIKVGVQKQSFVDLTQTNAPFAEVWFNVSQADEYSALFDELKRRHMQVGLHFWGALSDGTWTNIAYPDTDLINESLSMIKKTIDMAARHKFQYVNIHPGCAARVGIDFEKTRMDLRSAPIPFEQSIPLFVENAQTLHEYAQARGIIFTVETLPARVVKGWYDHAARANPTMIMNVYELPIAALEAAAGAGLWIANDFGHTAAIPSDNPRDLWTYLKEKTVNLSPQTRLIHLGFVTPPWNGTDIHNMLDPKLLNSDDAMPNKLQMIELLKLFKNRDDIWILTEPNGGHTENYFLAQKILAEALE